MRTDLNWTSTMRRFSMGGQPQVLGNLQERRKLIGVALPKSDRFSQVLILGTTLVAAIVLPFINSLVALLWVVGIGPSSMAVSGMVSSMGGRDWKRLVALLHGLFVISAVVVVAVNY